MNITKINGAKKCEGTGLDLKYVWGDALRDSKDCLGPNNMQYPTAQISRTFKNLWTGSNRMARYYQPQTIDPELTRKALLNNYKAVHHDSLSTNSRTGKYIIFLNL